MLAIYLDGITYCGSSHFSKHIAAPLDSTGWCQSVSRRGLSFKKVCCFLFAPPRQHAADEAVDMKRSGWAHAAPPQVDSSTQPSLLEAANLRFKLATACLCLQDPSEHTMNTTCVE